MMMFGHLNMFVQSNDIVIDKRRKNMNHLVRIGAIDNGWVYNKIDVIDVPCKDLFSMASKHVLYVWFYE
ncbi:hypothetical protein DICVIV_13766 [Dictyocaulus viviparus]|uniref:Uncharacterized protein n=1 Tax=Dictyocaulus viviparus TaxID=29172 RepID=A0A0D8X708_DICVI|nr:hypothetical protein DICVIV_13766 [Dictyocaulus viviparus]